MVWWVPQRHGPIDARSDGATYYILGTSLAQGRGYRLLNEPGEIRAVQYPPLLPLLVAACQKALDTSDFVVVGTWLRALYFFLSLALAASTYRLARDYLSPRQALLATAITALALHIWYLAGVLYTEVPLALVAVWFAICARRAHRPSYWLATAVLGVTAYALRTAGIALLAAWLTLALLARVKRSRAAKSTGWLGQVGARAAITILSVIAWQAYVGAVTASDEYRAPAYPYQRSAYQYSNVTYAENISLISPFAPERGRIGTLGRIKRFVTNAAYITPSLGGAVTAQRGFWEMAVREINRFAGREALPVWLALLPMTALGLVILTGVALMLRRREWLLPLCVGASACSMCLTPWPEQFVRYFTPMIPFLVIMLVTALGGAVELAKAAERTGGRRVAWVGRGFALVVLAVVLAQDGYVAWWTFRASSGSLVTYADAAGRRTSAPLLFYDKQAAGLDEVLEEVRRRAKTGDVMATTMPHWAYLRTGVKAVLPPMVADHEEARRLLDAVPVRFVVLDELAYPRISQRYAAPAVERHPDLWRPVYETADGHARLYERTQ
ncbi:MAG TPA: hypothetical protein VJX92_15730 [Methylomirabilota bacterium]|nr:hypothetical protein [Methylomirabilota bacterium]